MQAKNSLIRILRLLGKAVAGLVLLLVFLMLCVHLPFVQQKITTKATSYLSQKLQTRVEIGQIRFSLLGNLRANTIRLWDPSGNEILSVDELKLNVQPVELLSGRLNIDLISLSGFYGHLVAGEQGLNIRFIMDAFSSPTPSAKPQKDTRLLFREIQLKDFDFRYESLTDSSNLQIVWNEAVLHQASYATASNTIEASMVRLSKPSVQIVYHKNKALPPDHGAATPLQFHPDFGIGLGVNVSSLQIADGSFGYHLDSIKMVSEFDQDHIGIDNIQLLIEQASILQDTMSASLQNISLYVQGLDTIRIKGGVEMNKNTITLKEALLNSSKISLQANTKAWVSNATEANTINAVLDLTGRFNTSTLEYFHSLPGYEYFKDWGETTLNLIGEYVDTKGKLNRLEVGTTDSHLLAEGTVKGLEDLNQLSWENLQVSASLGPTFKRTLLLMTGDLPLPPAISLKGSTTGNPNRFYTNSTLLTSWGNARATGYLTPLTNGISFDANISAKKIQPGKWIEYEGISTLDADLHIKGTAGSRMDLVMDGKVSAIELYGKTIHDIELNGHVKDDGLSGKLHVYDPDYKAVIHTDITWTDTQHIILTMLPDDFRFGSLLGLDTSWALTGTLDADIQVADSLLRITTAGKPITIHHEETSYALDSFLFFSSFVPTSTLIDLQSNDIAAHVEANFDLLDQAEIFNQWPQHIFASPDSLFSRGGQRKITAQARIEEENIFPLLGVEIDSFSFLAFNAEWNEPEHHLMLDGSTSALSAYGMQVDSMHTHLFALEDSVAAELQGFQYVFGKNQLGDLNIQLSTRMDTIISGLRFLRDTTTWLAMDARILHEADRILIFPDRLHAIGADFNLPGVHPIEIKQGRYIFDDFQITHEDTYIRLDGDSEAFCANLQNLNLTRLNLILFQDSTIITNGAFDADLTYEKGRELDLDARVDSLRILDSAPLTMTISATTAGNEVPFEFLLKSETDRIALNGLYNFDTENVDATADLNISNPGAYTHLFPEYDFKPSGTITGEASIEGKILNPAIRGYVRFKDTSFETPRLKMRFLIEDERIDFADSSVVLKDFTLLDGKRRPLHINGNFTYPKNKPYTYDFRLNADHYTLLNTKPGSDEFISGTLILSTNTRLYGTAGDTHIETTLTVDDSTSLNYVLPSEDDALTDFQGIVEFVNPEHLEDSTMMDLKESVYDSLLAALPKFNLSSSIQVRDKTKLKILFNPTSGDYIEATGGGKLDMNYDRTGNLHLAGNYTIQGGEYQLSFYDLVKKKFTLVPGSSIDWSGNPRTGDLDIKAVYTVQSNSLGLIGNEISENEKSVYKRSLNYEIGINIKGTLEKPNVFFTLDLPAADKANYPVLANKLDRLRQPEFQSDLNKQVFGLLVLGGFLPESSTADVNSNQIATTALYNSVNSVLAAQLNRFAGQYLKGVNIDVGIQSYADYSNAGGKTQTAMDFRVSKSILNDRLSFEVGGDFDINTEQSGANTGDNYRGDVAIIYDLTGNGDKQLKLFNNESYDIVYQEINNTGISLIFIREFNKGEIKKKKKK